MKRFIGTMQYSMPYVFSYPNVGMGFGFVFVPETLSLSIQSPPFITAI